MRNIFISRRKFFKLSCIYSLFGLVIISVGGGILVHYFFDTSLGSMSVVDKNIWIDTFFVVILAPIFETFLLQWMVIQTTEENSKWKHKKKLAIFISAVFFGALHWYHPVYMVLTFVFGLFLAERFYYFYERTNYFSAFVYITIVHALMNLEVTLIQVIF